MSDSDKNTLKLMERDGNGLVKGIEHHYTKDGFVDWRKMIPAEYLYIKGEEQDITKVDDSQLISNLAGMRYLAKLRGYTGYDYEVHRATETYASVKCSIKWIPNYETSQLITTSSALASATLETTNELTSKYILETAQNRAFCRAVREFLNIRIVSQEESANPVEQKIDNSVAAEDAAQKIDLYAILQKTLEDKNLSWEWLKERLISLKIEGAENFKNIRDIPAGTKLASVIERVKKFKPKV